MQSEYVENLLLPVGLPLAYRRFTPYKNKPVPKPPYMIYDIERVQSYGADGENLICKNSVFLEYYSVKKDPANETKIEKAINCHEWEKYEDFLESENLYVVSYRFDYYSKIRR